MNNSKVNVQIGAIKMLRKFLICLAIFEIMCENTNLVSTNDSLDFLNTKRLNPYYHKLK